MGQQRLLKIVLKSLEEHNFKSVNKDTLIQQLAEKEITGSRHQKVIIEGALIGSLLRHGIATDIAIISDDAGQFNVFDHTLYWIHTERLIHPLIPLNEQRRQAVHWIRAQIWAIYADLQIYKKAPDEQLKKRIKEDFCNLFQTKTTYQTLNKLLKRIGKNQV